MNEPLTYTCARCRQTFESEWTNEEALAEKEQIFGAVPIEQCDPVCDDCFQVITKDNDGKTLEHFTAFHNPATKGSEPCVLDDCFWLKQERVISLASPEAIYVFRSFLRHELGLE